MSQAVMLEALLMSAQPVPASGIGFSGNLFNPSLDASQFMDAAVMQALRVTQQLARTDPVAFSRYVLRDEETGRRISMAPVHETWQDLLTKHDRVVVWSFVEAGKTAQVCVARVLYELGRNPNLRIAILSNTKEQAKKIVSSLKQYIERSEELKAVFPNLIPAHDLSLPWTATAFTVQRTDGVYSKDPSVQALGVHGAILGSRIDLLIVDDILDFENTQTQHLMDKVFGWLKASAIGRLTAHARVWAMTNAWHPRDPMHKLVAELGYREVRTPVYDPVTKRLAWEQRWPLSRITKARRDFGPAEFARQLMCKARDDDAARFPQKAIDAALDRGRGFRVVREIDPSELGQDFAIFTGVDLGVQQHAAADLSAFETILLWPDSTRQLLWSEGGRWTAPELVEKLDDYYVRYGGVQIVENVGAQDYILQFSRKLSRGVVKPFTTGRNKANPAFGIESIASEMAAGKWIIPNTRKSRAVVRGVHDLLSDMLYYDPREHTGDHLMALYFAREGARAFERAMGRNLGALSDPYDDMDEEVNDTARIPAELMQEMQDTVGAGGSAYYR